MADAGLGTVLRHVRRLAASQATGERTDRELLHEFLARHEDSAFVALVKRHGSLVLAVCRRVLRHEQDAEDAFQATFLVLARKAASIRKGEALAGWLHGVAYRIAMKAKRDAARRRLHEGKVKAVPHRAPPSDLAWPEVQAILDEEIQGLPQRYRAVFVLCCLEGKSRTEVGQELGLKEGTVRSRLSYARGRLRRRLSRCGITLSALLGAAALSQGASTAAVPALLLDTTVQAALRFAVGKAGSVSAKVAALAEGAARAMFVTKVKTAIAPALVLVASLIAGGAGLLINQPKAAEPAQPPARNGSKAAAAGATAKPRPAQSADAAKDQVEVHGRVQDPEGKPLAGAKLYVGYSHYVRGVAHCAREPVYPLRARSGADGRFRFSFAPAELEETHLEASRLYFKEVGGSEPAVIAMAAGYGPDWVVLGKGSDGLTLRLVPDLPIKGRILDADGKPVAGARLRVQVLYSYTRQGLTLWLQSLQQGADRRIPYKVWPGSLPGQPASVTTAVDGRFRLTGLGRDRLVVFSIEGRTIQHVGFWAVSRSSRTTWESPDKRQRIYGATFDYVAALSRLVRGVVRDQATGKPVAGVLMSASDSFYTTHTDKDGRYEMLGCPKSAPRNGMKTGYHVMARPPEGQLYFTATTDVDDTPGLAPITADIDLPGGIPLRGRVTDRATGKPPKKAVVEYYPLFPNAHARKLDYDGPASSASVRADGSYRLVVLPGPGVVAVAASPRDAYAPAVVTTKELAALFKDGNRPVGGMREHGDERFLYTTVGANGQGAIGQEGYHALTLIDPPERSASLRRDVVLSRARTLQGTVVGPDGKPLPGVTVSGLNGPVPPDPPDTLQGATFTVRRLAPGRTRELFFHHQAKNLVKVLTVHGDSTKPLTVRLEPSGSITGRAVDGDGQPIANTMMYVVYARVLGPGGGQARTDQDGRFRVDGLVPGQVYDARQAGGLLPAGRVKGAYFSSFTVKPGEVKDLGESKAELTNK